MSEAANQPKDAREAVKSSFSIRAGTRPAIRRASSTFGVTQGEIVNLAPALFSLLAERSLAERSEKLSRIEQIAGRVSELLSKISDLAPHLHVAISITGAHLEDAVRLETESIARREVHGVSQDLVDHSYFYGLGDYTDWSSDDPLLATLCEVVSDTESSLVSDVEMDIVDEQISFRCCEGDEEKRIRNKIGDMFAENVIDGILTEDESSKHAEDLGLLPEETASEEDLDDAEDE